MREDLKGQTFRLIKTKIVNITTSPKQHTVKDSKHNYFIKTTHSEGYQT